MTCFRPGSPSRTWSSSRCSVDVVELPLVVLIVDDDPGDVLLIKTALDEIGEPQMVHVAEDGDEAVAFLQRTEGYTDMPRPDLILLDLKMPRMDGRQVLAAIKGDQHLRSIPIIVLSTSE